MGPPGQTIDGSAASTPVPLTGLALFLAAFALALCNFIVVLDITIANVSVPHISGGLAVSPSQGLWVLTSYAVAEAITVPLTGWLAARFGTVRTLILCVAGFGLSSFLCGISPNIELLVLSRVLQGLSGGPIMPLTQAMLTRIFPPEKVPMAMGLWATTTIAAPIFGPILGGWISDNWSWHWIFFINLPVIAFCLLTFVRSLGRYETGIARPPLDRTGLFLLIVWVSAFQIMLETGREHDWFNSGTVVAMAIVAAIGFAAFVIWEWYEPHPVVNIRLLRDRTLAAATLAMSLGYGAFFASVVLVPLWMQQALGYNATNAGLVTGFQGVLAILVAPLAAGLLNRVDVRLTVSLGMLWLGLTTLLRLAWNTESTFWSLALPQLLQGLGMPFFFVGLSALSIAAVRTDQVASAAGIVTFSRTVAGAVATATASTLWIDNARVQRAEFVQGMNDASGAAAAMQGAGLTPGQSYSALEGIVEIQALTGAAHFVFALSFAIFLIAILSVWLAPRPDKALSPGEAH